MVWSWVHDYVVLWMLLWWANDWQILLCLIQSSNLQLLHDGRQIYSFLFYSQSQCFSLILLWECLEKWSKSLFCTHSHFYNNVWTKRSKIKYIWLEKAKLEFTKHKWSTTCLVVATDVMMIMMMMFFFKNFLLSFDNDYNNFERTNNTSIKVLEKYIKSSRKSIIKMPASINMLNLQEKH